MSSIEGIDKIGEQAARIEIQGPGEDGMRVAEADGIAKNGIEVKPGETATLVGDGNGTALPPADHDDGNDELFNSSAYVAVPEVDGQTTDKLVIAFSGSVAYDATDEAGARLFNDLALGKAVELRVAGYVANKQGTYKVTATEEEVVTGKAVVKVDTLYLLSPEHL